MDKADIKMLKIDMLELGEKINEQKKLIYKYILESIMKSIIIFGINDETTKDCINLFKNFRKISNLEEKLYSFIFNNGSKIDRDECELVLGLLSDINDDTVDYIYDMFDDYEEAFETGQSFRAHHKKRDFQYLIETDEYINEVIGLILGFDDIKKYFNFSEEFWEYIKPKIREVDSHDDEKHILYDVITHFDSNNCLDDMRIFIPKIVNLQTVLITINIIKKAYELYNLLGKSVPEEIFIFNEDANSDKEEFQKNYLLRYKKKFR